MTFRTSGVASICVVERLNTEFEGRVRIETIRWETAYYSAHDSFQEQIPEAADCDVVIAVFRARLGTKLPACFPATAVGRTLSERHRL